MADWTQINKAWFVEAMTIVAAKGDLPDSGFKKHQWTEIAAIFNRKSGNMYTKSQLQSQYSSLKAKSFTFQKLKNNSGFGWDDVNKYPTAPDSVWDDYLEIHPAAREFRNKTLPQYEELDNLFYGKVATGKYASSTLDGELDGGEVDFDVEVDDTPDGVAQGTFRSPSPVRNIQLDSASKGRGRVQEQQEPPGKKRKRAGTATDAVVTAMNQLISLAKPKEPIAVLNYEIEAVKLFRENYCADLTASERLMFKTCYLSDNPSKAKFFLDLEEDERGFFIAMHCK